MNGERLGNWIVEDEIGRDDLGRLFRARPADSTEKVRLKKLTHPKAQTPGFARLFLAQIELIRKLRHPNILSVLDGGEHAGVLYYVCEEPGGPDFQSLIAAGDKPTWQETLAIALQIVPAIRFAHRRSVLHRDLRPGNVFRCGDGTIKLAGFGVTKFFGDNLIGSAVEMLGSAAYLSPEQAVGKPQTKRTDFYSLGCLLYALIVGRPPFTGNSVVELTHKHCYALPERPIHFVRDLPEELDAFVMKLLAKESAQRPGSGTQLIQELDGIWTVQERLGRVGKRPQVAAPPDDKDEPEKEAPEPRLPELPPKPPTPWIRRWYVVLPAFLVCVSVLAWAFFIRSPRPPEDPDAQRRIDQQGELNRALLAGANVRYASPAERFYQEGIRLLQAGDHAAAGKVWEGLIVAFRPLESEKRWVDLAAEGLERLKARHPSRQIGVDHWKQALGPVLDEIRRSPPAQAGAMADALLLLYRDDPDVAALRELLQPYRK